MKSKFIQNNWLIIILIIISTLTELLGVFLSCGKFYIRNPLVFLSIMFIFASILYLIRNKKARLIVASLMYILIGGLNIGFVLLDFMTGQIFEYSMLELQEDGLTALENIQLNFSITFIVGIILAALIIYGKYINLKTIALPKLKNYGFKLFFLLFASASFFIVLINLSFNNKTIYENFLYSKSDYDYSELGITTNTFAQLLLGPKGSPKVVVSDEEIVEYIFDEDEIYYSKFKNNKDKNYNVITILCESFEWMGIIENKDLFPNGLNLTIPLEYQNLNKSAAELLFPNIYQFMKESIVFTNYHSKEKTDISENLTHFGSYPNEVLTNYKFADNCYPQSDANMLKTIFPDIKANAYHNGFYKTYNRNNFELTLGFENYYAQEQLKKYGLKDYGYDHSLDSELITAINEISFPTDERFFNYIITLTQHGNYEYRNNLKEHYEELAKFGLTFNNNDDHNRFVTYVATARELDKAIGNLNRILEEKGLKDNTIITLYADHNSYYDDLSNYIKDIKSIQDAKKQGRNYLDLYKLPLIMYIPNNEPQVIDKFISTADILPTILDILGINYYKNIYFGNSAFSDEISLLHSRAYNFFTDGKIYYSSLENIKFQYQESKLTEELIDKTKKLVEKMLYIDNIIFSDFFHKEVNNDLKINNIKTYEDFYNYKIKEINN